jgi:UDP-N-acetylmuramoyl-L-alanyl-D-glutamate--2,6-diaminopimelate ligase
MKKKLSQIVSDLPHSHVDGDLSVDITGITYSSKKVEEGNLFVCIKGLNVDGHDFAMEAHERGARAFLVEQQLDLPGTTIRVKDTRKGLALVSKAFYGQPGMKLIGITGTNGKTTTSYLIKSFLDNLGLRSGLIGTIEYALAAERVISFRTTPESSDLFRFFHEMEKNGVTHVVMEVTSHGLALDRVYGVDFDVAVFTNLSQDHLDFHENLEEYKKTKLSLFAGLSDNAICVLNADDPVSLEIAGITNARKITYAVDNPADITATFTELGWTGTRIVLASGGEKVDLTTKILGRHNVYNTLAAYSVGCMLGLDRKKVVDGLAQLESIPGRFEVIAEKPRVLIDYAHTPHGLEVLLTSVARLTEGSVIAVFGCGGERDREKRPIMGKISAELADITFVTSDNPRSESPDSIIDGIMQGVDTADSRVTRCPDRREAIRRAILAASPVDTVVIAGRGHEKFQLVGPTHVPFNDREVAKEIHESLRGRDR